MKLVIDIPDEEYEDVKKTSGCYYDFGKAIYYGTPLPKGHGDLKDADEIKEFYRKKLVSNLVDEERGLDWSEYAELPCKVFNEVIDEALEREIWTVSRLNPLEFSVEFVESVWITH